MLIEASIPSASESLSDRHNRAVPPAAHPVQRVDVVPYRLTGPISMDILQPQPGELLLWRFRSEWRLISKDAAYAHLSRAELTRVRNYPNPALRKRFAVSRAVLREILSRLIDRAPHDVALGDDLHGRPLLRHAGTSVPLAVSVAYAGIWILVGVSTASIGIATHVPTLPESSDAGPAPDTAAADQHKTAKLTRVRSRVRHASLVDAAGRPLLEANDEILHHGNKDCFVDTPKGDRWHVLDLPMPGSICAAAALAQPVSRVHAFGWTGSGGWDIAS